MFQILDEERAAKWRLHETDKTRNSLFAQLIKKLNHWDHRISNVGRGVSIRETLIEDCFKSWSLELCIFRKSDAWLLKKIGTPWAVFLHLPFYDKKICASFQSLIDIWVGKFAFDSMCWYCHLEIRMVLIRGTRIVAHGMKLQIWRKKTLAYRIIVCFRGYTK